MRDRFPGVHDGWARFDGPAGTRYISRRTSQIDIAAIGCDVLVCSPYKWYGSHAGVLCGRIDVLEDIAPYKVRLAATGGAVRAGVGCYTTDDDAERLLTAVATPAKQD